MNNYIAKYGTPSTSYGSAYVSADGIFGAIERAKFAINILTGYSDHDIIINEIIDLEKNIKVWENY